MDAILIASSGLAGLIREGKTQQVSSYIQGGTGEGMQAMDTALARLVKEGTVTAHDALEKALDKERFVKLPFVAREVSEHVA